MTTLWSSITARLPWRFRAGAHRRWGTPCSVCGERTLTVHRPALSAELIGQWELDARWARWFEIREGDHCFFCASSRRTRQLAATLLDECRRRWQIAANNLAELVDHNGFQRLAVAEINSCGDLHHFLKRHPRLAYSEYGSRDPRVPAEDLQSLSYAAQSFDLVLTSESLEHVSDVRRALREIRRVLRPSGCHIFTVPVVADRPCSRVRAQCEAGQVRHLCPPSYHGAPGTQHDDYLVFYEFGADFEALVRECGFELAASRDAQNPALVTYVAWLPT